MAQRVALPGLKWARALRRQLRHLRRWFLWRERFLWLRAELQALPQEQALFPVRCYSFGERALFLQHLASEQAQRLARLWEALPQSWVFAASDTDTPVAYYCFVTVGTVWIDEFGIRRHFDAGEAYVHTCYTIPSHRGRGFHRQTLQTVCTVLRQRGFRRAYAVVSARNEPSLRGFLRAGFQVAGSVVHYCFCGHVVRTRPMFTGSRGA